MIKQKERVLGVASKPINKKIIQDTKSGNLKHYYEPKQNAVEEVSLSWLPYLPKYTINNDTLNERFDYNIKKKEGVFRIITLGDSFTFGENVDTKDNYSEQLEDMLNAKCLSNEFEVINLGVRGYDIQYMNERYLKRGVKYKPDLVIALIGDFQLFRLNEEIYNRREEIKKKIPHLDAISVAKKASEEIVSDFGWSAILEWQSSQLKKLVSSIGSKLIFMKFPLLKNSSVYIWGETIFEYRPFIEYDNLFKKISVNNKQTYFYNDFEWDNRYILKDGHPSSEGQKAIANYIFNYSIKNNLIPCSP